MVKKLPSFVIGRWSRHVDKCIFETESNTWIPSSVPGTRMHSFGYPSFADFCQFIEKEARSACNRVISVQALKSEEVKLRRPEAQISKFPSIRSLHTNADEVNRAKGHVKTTCIYCKEQNNHELSECKRFTEMPVADRRAFIIAKRLCWGCLKWGHINSSCRRKRICKKCNGLHPTSMHSDQIPPPNSAKKEIEPEEDKEHASNVPETSVSHRLDVDSGTDNSFATHSLIIPVWVGTSLHRIKKFWFMLCSTNSLMHVSRHGHCG